MDALLASEKPASEVRASAVANAKATLESADAKQKECSANVISAKDAEKEAAAGVKAAEKAVADYQPEFKAATELRDEKKQELDSFAETTVGCFEKLKERFSAKKMREIKAAEEAARQAE